MALTLEMYLTFILLLISFQSTYQLKAKTIPSMAMIEMHERWMEQHGRTYISKEQKMERSKIFAKNVEFVKNFNKAQNKTYELEINKFADLTREEFVGAYTGNTNPPRPMLSKSSFKYENVSLTEIPPSLDWRMMGAVTDVKEQLGCGSCWAFAAVGAVEGINQIRTGQLIPLSEQQIIDCDDNPNGCNGNYIESALDYVIRSGGLVFEPKYAYKAQEQLCQISQGCPYPLAVRIIGRESTPVYDEGALLQAILHQPVAVSIDPQLIIFYKNGIVSGQCGTLRIHALTLVGYGVSEDGMKYWILKNSWGPSWGENGYVRIQRDAGIKEGMCGIAMGSSYPIM